MRWIMLPIALLLDGIDARSKGVARPTLAAVAPGHRQPRRHLPQASPRALAGDKQGWARVTAARRVHTLARARVWQCDQPD